MAIAIETSQSLTGITIPEPDADQNKESLHHIDLEDFDVNANEDGLALPPEDELTTKKMASRRKIEMYWEKRGYRNNMGDFGEIDFDF